MIAKAWRACNSLPDGCAGTLWTRMITAALGLMALHWRTEILSPNAAALAQAAWDQSWNKPVEGKKPRYLPVDDFYADWAQANFGLAEAGKIFAGIDGKAPSVTEGGYPMGDLKPLMTEWEKIAPKFAFLLELEELRGQIKGAGNLERYDYWLNTFRYLVATPKGRLGKLEAELASKPWQQVREGIEVKLCPKEGELYVFTQSRDRVGKERSMRRRALRKLLKRLAELRAMASLKRD